jgi:hypothetical protein
LDYLFQNLIGPLLWANHSDLDHSIRLQSRKLKPEQAVPDTDILLLWFAVGTSDEHALGPQLPDEPARVPGTGRAVMPHREVDESLWKVDGRGELI